VKILASNLVTNIRLAYIRTRQALQFTQSALNIFQQLNIFGLPPNPIKVTRYNDAISGFTNASAVFFTLPLDIQYPDDPIFPNDPLFPPNVNNQVIIRLAQYRTLLAIDRTDDAIQYIDSAILLTDSDTLNGLLVTIKLFLEDALIALDEAFKFPPVATDS
jgi:hypothetical protein